MLFKKALWISVALLLAAGNAVADDADDDFVDACKTQEDALDTCVETNCQPCPSEVEAFPDLDLIGAEDGSPPDVQDLLDATCDWIKDVVCEEKECCPKCVDALEAYYTCFGDEDADFESDCNLAELKCDGGKVAKVGSGATGLRSMSVSFLAGMMMMMML